MSSDAPVLSPKASTPVPLPKKKMSKAILSSPAREPLPFEPAPESLEGLGDSVVLGLYSCSGAGVAIAANDFHQQELVDTIIRHVRSSDPAVSQRGITTLLKYTESVAKLAGHIGRATLEETRKTNENTSHRKVITTQGIIPPTAPTTGDKGRRFHPPSVPAAN